MTKQNRHFTRRMLIKGSAASALGAALPVALAPQALAQFAAPDATYSQDELIDTGHRFFGAVSKGLAKSVEYVFQRAGRPNGYILGEEGSGAFVAGLRYGEGTLYTKNAGLHQSFWQGPSIGWDFGGEGARTMMLIYNLRSVSDMYRYYGGVNGSAYVVGGFGVSFFANSPVMVAPIQSGVGARLGVNAGYLKFTRRPTWNPF